MQTPHRDDDPKSFNEVLERNTLGKLVEKARQIQTLEKILRPLLPPEFAKSCYVLNIDKRCIVLGVANAAIATRMRFLDNALILALQKIPEFQQFQTIQCRVRTQAH